MARRLVIASSSNRRLGALRRLARRGSAELCLAEGARAVAAALAGGAEIRELYVANKLLLRCDVRSLADRAEERGAHVIEVETSAFTGLVATVVRPRASLASLHLPPNALVAVAVGIERPGNLGTIIRTACGAGVDAFVAADPCTDVYHPEVVRGSVGTVFHVRPAISTTAETLAWLEERRFTVVATTPAGELDYSYGDYGGNVAIVVGSERHGLPDRWLKACHRRIAIPLAGAADSLNVAVAFGVVVFQAVVDRNAARSSC